ncbi:MAG: endonuclease domain-containing protein [Polyangiaceae bacterium]
MRHSRQRIQVLKQRATQMRHAPTASEAKLFEALRGGRLGVSFRRQVPLAGRFIADLYAAEVKLVVEVDGGYHAARERADARRDRALARIGCHVLRLPDDLVMNDLLAVVERIRAEIERLRGSASR